MLVLLPFQVSFSFFCPAPPCLLCSSQPMRYPTQPSPVLPSPAPSYPAQLSHPALQPSPAGPSLTLPCLFEIDVSLPRPDLPCPGPARPCPAAALLLPCLGPGPPWPPWPALLCPRALPTPLCFFQPTPPCFRDTLTRDIETCPNASAQHFKLD